MTELKTKLLTALREGVDILKGLKPHRFPGDWIEQAESLLNETQSVEIGICHVCGCTDDDCHQCIQRTGQPCAWANPEHTLCTACATAQAPATTKKEALAFSAQASSVNCPYCQHRNDGLLGDPRGKEAVCDHCEESFFISPEAEIEID